MGFLFPSTSWDKQQPPAQVVNDNGRLADGRQFWNNDPSVIRYVTDKAVIRLFCSVWHVSACPVGGGVVGGMSRSGIQVSREWQSLFLQDWKEKYIHENYTRIFTENYMEEVCASEMDRAEIPSTSGFCMSWGLSYSYGWSKMSNSKSQKFDHVWLCVAALSRCILVPSVHTRGLWWNCGRDGTLRLMVWRKTWGQCPCGAADCPSEALCMNNQTAGGEALSQKARSHENVALYEHSKNFSSVRRERSSEGQSSHL